MNYHIEKGDLVVSESSTGQVIWRGRPDGFPVEKVLPIPDSDDGIVLLDFKATQQPPEFHNILRCRPDGSIVWRAELKPYSGSGDCYVSVYLREGRLVANTFSCFFTTLDLATGKVRDREFVK